VEKTLRLGIPQKTRDSHFPTAATTTAPFLSAASRSHTSIPPGGYDVSRLFQVCAQILRLPTFTVDFTLSGALLSLSSFGTRGTSSDLRATRLVCYLFGQSVLCYRFARITILSALFFPHSIVVRRHAVWPRNKPQLGQPNRGSSLPALLHRRRSKIGGRHAIHFST
jgi:hypothetical protein